MMWAFRFNVKKMGIRAQTRAFCGVPKRILLDEVALIKNFTTPFEYPADFLGYVTDAIKDHDISSLAFKVCCSGQGHWIMSF